MSKIFCVVSMLALTGFAAYGATTDDIVELAKKGEPEDKILSAIEATDAEFDMSAAEVIRLREAKLSDKVIVAMLQHTGKQNKAIAAAPKAPEAPLLSPRVAQAAPAAPFAPAAPPAPPVVRDLPLPVLTGEGKLTLDNLDDRTYAYFYEPAVQTLWLGRPDGNAGVVSAHNRQTIVMKAGTYKIRFTGQAEEGVTVTVYGNENSAINVARVRIGDVETLQATAFERGERKGTGKLATVAALSAIPQETIVERRIVETPVYQEAPVYYYGGPTYYYGPRYSPYYGGSGVFLNFGIGGGGGYRHRR